MATTIVNDGCWILLTIIWWCICKDT